MSTAISPSRAGPRPDVQAVTAQAAVGFAVTGLGACIALLARDLDVPATEVGWLSSAFGAGLLLVAATGRWLLRRGPQPLLRAATLTAAAGAGVLAWAPGMVLAASAALVLGVGCAGIVLVTPALLAGGRAAVRMAQATAASSAAGVLAPLSMGLLDAAGAGGRLALLAVVPPLVLVGLSAAPPAGGAGSPPPPAPSVARGTGRRAAARTLRVFLAVSVEFCFYVWSVARLRDAGVAAAGAAALSAAFPIGMAAGRLAGATLADRMPVVPAAAAVAALGAVGVATGGSPAVVTAALAVAGAGIALLYPVTLADLVGIRGLPASRAVSLGALASGAAILSAPAALAAVGSEVALGTAFLITLPLLALLVAIPPRGRSPATEAG